MLVSSGASLTSWGEGASLALVNGHPSSDEYHDKNALSIISKQRELYESKHVSEECRCLKI